MNAPRAAPMPERRADPYPRCGTRTTRAPSFSAISIEPSVEPLSATTTSPHRPAARNASIAFETQTPREFASFKHGITTDTSTWSSTDAEAKCNLLSVFGDPILSAFATPPHAITARSSSFQFRLFRLAFSITHIIMAELRKVSETLQLPNQPDLSSTPGGSASSGSLDSMATAARGRGRLLKVLGMWFGISAAVGNTIAAGIVRAPGDIAQWLPNIYLFFGVWVVGGLYALSGASSMAELGAAIPRSGGQYNFSRRALGDYAGFLVGWSDWLSTCGTAAAVAIVIAEYTATFLPLLNGKAVLFRYEFTYQQIAAVLIIFGFFVLQWRGIKWGSNAQLIKAALKTGA